MPDSKEVLLKKIENLKRRKNQLSKIIEESLRRTVAAELHIDINDPQYKTLLDNFIKNNAKLVINTDLKSIDDEISEITNNLTEVASEES